MTTDRSKAFDFTPAVYEINGRFFCLIHEINALGEGATLDQAYRQAIEKKERLIEEYTRVGALNRLPRPRSMTGSPVLKGGLIDFAVKTLIVVAITGIILGGSGYVAGRALLHQANKTASKYLAAADGLKGRKFWSKVDEAIERAANRGLPPEDVERIRGNVAKLAGKIAPITGELSPLFGGAACGQR